MNPYPKRNIYWLALDTADIKQRWAAVMVVDGAYYFPDVFGKPVAPTMKRWRRLRRLLMKEAQNGTS